MLLKSVMRSRNVVVEDVLERQRGEVFVCGLWAAFRSLSILDVNTRCCDDATFEGQRVTVLKCVNAGQFRRWDMWRMAGECIRCRRQVAKPVPQRCCSAASVRVVTEHTEALGMPVRRCRVSQC